MSNRWWEVSVGSERKGSLSRTRNRPAGFSVPSRGGKLRHRPLLALQDASARRDSNCANCFTLSTCCSRSCLSVRSPHAPPPQPRAPAARRTALATNRVSRPGRRSGSRYIGSDGTSRPRCTARTTPQSSTPVRSHRSGTRSWRPCKLGVGSGAAVDGRCTGPTSRRCAGGRCVHHRGAGTGKRARTARRRSPGSAGFRAAGAVGRGS